MCSQQFAIAELALYTWAKKAKDVSPNIMKAHVRKLGCCRRFTIDRLEEEQQGAAFPIDEDVWNDFCDKVDVELAPIAKYMFAFLLSGIPGSALVIFAVTFKYSFRYILWLIGTCWFVSYLSLIFVIRCFNHKLEKRLRDLCEELEYESNIPIILGQERGNCGCDFAYFVKINEQDREGFQNTTAPPSVCGSEDEEQPVSQKKEEHAENLEAVASILAHDEGNDEEYQRDIL